MKNSKKLLALLLALVMTVAMFAACSKDEDGDDDDKEEKTKTEETAKAPDESEEPEESGNSEEDAVKAAMKTFCDGYEAMDTDKMLRVVDENGAAYEKVQSLTTAYEKFEEVTAQLAENFGEDGDEIAAMMLDMIAMSAKVKNVKVDGDSAEVTVELSNSDFSTFAEDFQAAYSEAVTAMLTEDVLAEAEEMTEEEQYELGIQLGIKAAKEVLAEFELETVTQTGTMILENVDGEWLIVDTKA